MVGNTLIALRLLVHARKNPEACDIENACHIYLAVAWMWEAWMREWMRGMHVGSIYQAVHVGMDVGHGCGAWMWEASIKLLLM
eukprot:108325-Pelagomonas_calceolata.AAC.1